MSSGFATVRCIRCGSYTQGGQFCAPCIERQQADEAARAERVAQTIADRPAGASSAAGGICPACGRYANAGAKFCGYCRFQFGTLSDRLEQLQYVGFWIRFVAFIIDATILGAIGFAIGAVNIREAFLLQFLARAVYSIGFWLGRGATPGKMVMGIKVVMTNGDPVKLGPAVLRYVGYTLSALLFFFISFIGLLMIAFPAEILGLHGNTADAFLVFTLALLFFSIGFWMIEFNAQKKGPHDYLANTVVVRSRYLTT
jgi:uncharacterized RDD family membrane protein YckC